MSLLSSISGLLKKVNLTITSTSHFIVNCVLAFITTIESTQSTIFESVIYKTIHRVMALWKLEVLSWTM